MAALGLMSDEE